MTNGSVVVQHQRGRVELTAAALVGLVVHAAEQVPGITVRRSRGGVQVAVDGAAATVALSVSVPLTAVLPELGRSVQDAVAIAFQTSAGLVARVDVLVSELLP